MSLLSQLVASGFLAVGLINFLPVIGVIGAAQLQRLYQVSIADTDLALLMQHRALLLSIVGALLVAAAFRTELRTAAALAGLTSMVGYLLIIGLGGTSNASLIKVAWIDVAAVVILLAALVGDVTLRRAG
ncbi:MAG: phosphopantetheine adenylyltransferase [Pseudomonadota bacterium]